MGNKLKLYDTNAIYFLPVGKNKDCGVLESGGSSPLGGEWNYAFVAVTYDGNGYGYYFSDININSPISYFFIVEGEFGHGMVLAAIYKKSIELQNIFLNQIIYSKSEIL